MRQPSPSAAAPRSSSVGDAWFRQRLHIADPRLLAAAALPALATILLGTGLAAAAQLAGLVARFLAVFVLEAPSLGRQRLGTPAP